MTDAPTFMRTFGPAADPLTDLAWTLSLIAAAVVLIVAGLLAVALFRRREATDPSAVVRSPGRKRWIYIGTGVSTAVLAVTLGLTLRVLYQSARPSGNPAVRVSVIGHQWWWELRYSDGAGTYSFVTANELHLPVGEPIALELSTADVIHSFWVPQLAGKTDLIPGRINRAWIQASRPGRYFGTCAEYCGLQHAHMQLAVVAEDPLAFAAWAGRQRESARDSPGSSIFASRCGPCHAVRGSVATGTIGPDLTHLMSRSTLAAGMLPNTRGYLAGWISNPDHLKPGVLMPAVPLRSAELQLLLAYLGTLE